MAGSEVTECTCCSTFEQFCRCVKDLDPTLYNVRRIFTLLTQFLFSDSSRLAGLEEALACRTYTPGDANSLKVAPATVVDPGSTENVPGVLIQCGEEGMQFTKVSMEPEMNETPDFAAHEEVWQFDCSVQFRCMDRDADIAGMMAEAIMLFVVALRPKLYRTLQWLKDYVPVSVSEPRLTKNDLDDTSSDRYYESIAAVKITGTYRVYVAEESKRLKDFSIITEPEAGLIDVGQP